VTSASRRSWARRTAIACAALMLAVTLLSAFVRLASLGPGCEPWPVCYHERPAMAARYSAETATSPAVEAARGAHRMAASTVLVVIVVLLVLSLGPRPYLQREGRHAMALLLLAVFLTVLGRWSAGVPSPGVVLGNLVGGFLMFALCVRLAWPAATPGPADSGVALNLALGLVLLQVAGGAMGHPLHRYAAAAVLLGVGWLAWKQLRSAARGVAVALALLLALQLALGLAQFALGLPLALVLAHNVTAMLLLTVLLRLKPLPLLDGPRAPRP
jgi:heme a synthase